MESTDQINNIKNNNVSYCFTNIKDKIISFCITNKRPILIFIFTLLLTILTCIPHYDEHGNYKLFGKYKTKDEVIYLKKFKDINIRNIEYESLMSS